MIRFRTSLLTLAAFAVAPAAHAISPIVRPYDSIRTRAMGGVFVTTGLYDQNFFGNPARVTANPQWRIQLPDPMFETSQSTIGNISDLTSGEGDTLQNLAGTAGKNNHLRFQMTFPGFYWPNVGGGKWSYAFAVLTSLQGRTAILNSTNDLDQAVIADVAPAFTVGRKFLADDRLSVGVTAHANYRLSSNGLSIFDLLGGQGFNVSELSAEGGQFDFDLGGTYRLPFTPFGAELTAGASINNLLGGKYENLGLDLLGEVQNGGVLAQPRAVNVGFSARLPNGLGPFQNPMLAFEVTDIGNAGGGSLFRLLHLGAEARWGVLLPRLGLNQGYLGGGLGVDLKFFQLDLAYYGEELGLNSGVRQDRRLALRLDFRI